MKISQKDLKKLLSGLPYAVLRAEIASRDSKRSWGTPARFTVARQEGLAKARAVRLTQRRAAYIEKTLRNAAQTEENIASHVV